MDFLREKEKEASGRPSLSEKRQSSKAPESAVADSPSDEDTNIESNVDFLRTMEDQEASKGSKKERRRDSAAHRSKRSSLPSMALSGTKNLLAGKFGDAFKRFEQNVSPTVPRTPSPLQDMGRRVLTPIAGSEATDGRSDDGNILDDMDSMPPEQRREIERRRLSMEELRVANAAAEYRKRLADRGPGAPKSIGGVSRAASIQHKVQSLLDENQAPSPVKKTAEGYGRFTDSGPSAQASQFEQQSSNPYSKPLASTPRTPLAPTRPIPIQRQPQKHQQPDSSLQYAKPRTAHPSQPSSTITSPAAITKTGPRPNAPPKPMHLNSIPTGSPPKPLPSLPPRLDMSEREKEDYVQEFAKRFPSLNGIEMVERAIEVERPPVRDGPGGMRSREV